jgi:hypothetical protein
MKNILFFVILLVQNVLRWMRNKVKAIQECLTFKSIIKVRSFHGLINFYKRFVKDFSTLAAPLTKIVKIFMGFK